MVRSMYAALASAALITAGSAVPAAAHSSSGLTGAVDGSVAMVVAAPGAPSAAEGKLEEHLVAAGYTVVFRDDDIVTVEELAGADFVLISSTVSSVLLGDRLASVPASLWIGKPYLFDDYGLTGATAEVDYGTKRATKVKITDASHPLAAGYEGKVKIYAAEKSVSWGKPVAAATVVAKVKTDPTIISIDQGATLADGTVAAGCRLTFPIYETAPLGFTTKGWKLFDAAAAWAAAGCA